MENNGSKIIQVPLSNSDKHVIIYEEDFKELMRLGVTPRWCLIRGTVSIWLQSIRKAVGVARILMDVKAGQTIKCLNKDLLDLRRDNLVLTRGQGTYEARKLLEETKRTKTNSQRVAS